MRRLLRAGLLEGYEGGKGTKRPRLKVYADSIAAYQRSREIEAVNQNAPPGPRAPKPLVDDAVYREMMVKLKEAGLI